MWLFHRAIAQHRVKYNLVVKIEAHRDTHVSGMREGRVLAEPNPRHHPVPTTILPDVLVKFTDGKQRERVEPIPVAALRPTSRLHNKGTHVIIKGELSGMLVTHVKSDGPLARVFAIGKPKSTAFYIEKNKLCIAEK